MNRINGLLLAILMALVSCGDQPEMSTNVEGNEKPSMNDRESANGEVRYNDPIEGLALEQDNVDTVSALSLYNSYKQNLVKADKKYFRKNIVLEGIITEIATENGKVRITLDYGVPTSIQCFMLPGHDNQIEQVSVDSKVKLRGICLGKRTVKSNGDFVDYWHLVLVGCSLVI